MFAVSEKGLAFVACREACSLTAYADTHMLAVGFGQNDPSLKPGDTIALEHAIDLFVNKAKADAIQLTRIFDGVLLDQQHVDSLWSLGYNIGFGALGRDTELVNAVKAFRTDPRNRELRDAAGFEIVRPFNLSRRCREALVFVSGDYGDLSTLQLWEAGKSPKNTPPDPPTVVPMPTFLKG
jgi:GH24 family phage-related lysozyme (muramidase)